MTIHQLAPLPRITIGAGARRQFGAIAGSLVPAGAPVLLVADPGLRATGMIDEIASLVRKAGSPVAIFDDIKSDPTIAQADAAAALARESGAELLVALGGGSALDLGKAVAAIAGAAPSALAYALCAAPFPAGRLKTICLPTTSGTGSETTRTAILSGPDQAKLWYWGEALRADEVILDAELTVSLPPFLTAATGIDALVHAVEAATNRNAHAANDMFALEAIRLVAENLETAVSRPHDLGARQAMQRAAALAGTAIDNCGTAIAHNIGHALASLRPLHHGRAVGIAMLAALPWVTAGDSEGRFAACAAAMGAEPTADGFIQAYEALVRRVGLQVSLAEEFSGISPETLAAQMLRPENIAMIRSNRREASESDLLHLAQAVLAAA
jgi:alcohol dehydrogenase class IV